ncbi:MAG: DUF1275 domain-containing protein [Ruminococcus sp.]|nr:DUF1275 domain-containing protein [Ruminococcus sp.]
MITKRQMSETYLVAAILASAGGFLDAYSYIVRGRVFANAQTGNIVLLGMNFFERDWLGCAKYLLPIIMFVAGVLLADRMRIKLADSSMHWRQYIILIEAITLAGVSYLPVGGEYDLVANTLISFVCSLQVESFRKVHSISFATTMCTGNLRTATEHVSLYATTKDEEHLKAAFKLYGIIAFFILGVIMGNLICSALERAGLIFVIFQLIAVFVLMFIDVEKQNGSKKTKQENAPGEDASPEDSTEDD